MTACVIEHLDSARVDTEDPSGELQTKLWEEICRRLSDAGDATTPEREVIAAVSAGMDPMPKRSKSGQRKGDRRAEVLRTSLSGLEKGGFISRSNGGISRAK